MKRRPRGPAEGRKRLLESALRRWRGEYRAVSGNGYAMVRRKYAAAMCERYFQELKALKS